jgi:hypothetical protein
MVLENCTRDGVKALSRQQITKWTSGIAGFTQLEEGVPRLLK